MTVRNLDPQLAAILDAIQGGGMFDEGASFEEIRERFEQTAPLMWDATGMPVDATEDRVLDGPGGPLPVRIYTPPGSGAAGLGEGGDPVLVYFHGGGFTSGSIQTADPMSRFLAREADCLVVTVGFRLAPEDPFPAPVDDCVAALRWVRANAASFGGDAARVAVGGDAVRRDLRGRVRASSRKAIRVRRSRSSCCSAPAPTSRPGTPRESSSPTTRSSPPRWSTR